MIDEQLHKSKPTPKKRSKADTIFIICMMVIPLMHFAVFTLYINFNSFVMAFQDVDYVTNTVNFVGLKNFQRFALEWGENDIWKIALKNSFWYFPVTALIMLPLSIVSGYFLYRKIRFSKIFIVVFFLPSIISIVVLAIVFRNMFDSSIGPINWILKNVVKMEPEAIPAWLTDKKYAMNTLYIYAIWAGIGYNVVLLFGAMSRMPVEIIESARLDGIGMFREIFQIFVPIIWPTISTLIVFGAMTVFTQFLHPMVLTPGGTGGTWTIAYIVINKINNGRQFYGAALGLMIAAVAVPTIQFVKFIAGKIFETVEV